MHIPTTTTRTLCDAERFCIGLKMLAEECNMSYIDYCGLGIKMFNFCDGSSIGGLRAYVDAGLIDINNDIKNTKYINNVK